MEKIRISRLPSIFQKVRVRNGVSVRDGVTDRVIGTGFTAGVGATGTGAGSVQDVFFTFRDMALPPERPCSDTQYCHQQLVSILLVIEHH